MPFLRDRSGVLRLDDIDLTELVQRFGTPSYVYDLDAIAREARTLRSAFDGLSHLVAYAVKANAAGRVVRTLAGEGCGADVVSGAELLVALACGIGPERIVFSGVAKTDEELDRAIACGARGIVAVQIESPEEITRVEARARATGRKARVSIRVNPEIDLKDATHANIATGHAAAKFGVPSADVPRAAAMVVASQYLELVGLATHVGSQLTSTLPYVQSARVLFGMARELRAAGRGRSLSFLDTGGGFGIDYGDRLPQREAGGSAQPSPTPADFVRAVRAEQRASGVDDLALYIEPGRSLVAAHGVLLARVVQTKVTNDIRWLMIDAGMNDLLRPALYQALHRIVPLEQAIDDRTAMPWRVVGPVCESTDDFGRHLLPREPPRAVAVLDTGAYGYAMASQYNGRQLPVEVFVADGRVVGHTRRPSVEAWAQERAAAGA
jgi:diaminopimelate decarboxylase